MSRPGPISPTEPSPPGEAPGRFSTPLPPGEAARRAGEGASRHQVGRPKGAAAPRTDGRPTFAAPSDRPSPARRAPSPEGRGVQGARTYQESRLRRNEPNRHDETNPIATTNRTQAPRRNEANFAGRIQQRRAPSEANDRSTRPNASGGTSKRATCFVAISSRAPFFRARYYVFNSDGCREPQMEPGHTYKGVSTAPGTERTQRPIAPNEPNDRLSRTNPTTVLAERTQFPARRANPTSGAPNEPNGGLP